MIKTRRFITAGGTLACAAATGFVMQNGEALAAALGMADPQTGASAYSSASLGVLPIAGFAAPEPTPLAFARAAEPLAESPKFAEPPTLAQPVAIPEVAAQTVAAPSADCDVTLSAEPEAAALVTLVMEAPCRADEQLTVAHAGLRFTDTVAEDGLYMVTIPALTEEARFSITFTNGDTVTTRHMMPTVRDYDRVAIQWEGDSGLQLHALEFGARYGDSGHVWSGAPQTSLRGVRAQGGFLMRLGNAAIQNAEIAEVYTFPSSRMARAGTIRVTVEAEVTEQNCGQEVGGVAFQPGADGSLQDTALTLAIPACDAVGDILVLKNLLRDLKVAGN